MRKPWRRTVIALTTILLTACAGMMTIVPQEERSLQLVREIRLSKDQIFDKSLEWMAQTFVDSKSVIELKDRDNGKIIGKGVTKFRNAVVYVPCRFTLILEVKDGKYRTTFTNFTGLWNDGSSSLLEYKSQIDDVKASLVLINASLYEYLKNSNSSSNW
jgi:hypothetical protein